MLLKRILTKQDIDLKTRVKGLIFENKCPCTCKLCSKDYKGYPEFPLFPEDVGKIIIYDTETKIIQIENNEQFEKRITNNLTKNIL